MPLGHLGQASPESPGHFWIAVLPVVEAFNHLLTPEGRPAGAGL